jgi:glyoxylase-like metal-dependent hydrolase (beta-lactamase superfamily II)
MQGFMRFMIVATAAVLQLAAQDPAAVGVHRYALGKVQVISLQDGLFQLPISLLTGIKPEEAKALLGGKDISPTPVNAFLVRMPHQLVLVDTGAGTGAGEAAGHLPERLKAAGVDSAKIDLVLITHFHMDHVGGLLKADGTRAFPNALLRASQAENDFWTGDPAKVPERSRKNLPAIKAILTAYAAAGAYRPFAPGESLGEGIRILPTSGHTPGHTCYAFASEGKELWCLGDLIHFGAVQFPRPSVALAFDWDSTLAIAARKELFQKAAQAHGVLAGAHLAFPGLFKLEPNGEGYAAVAVN